MICKVKTSEVFFWRSPSEMSGEFWLLGKTEGFDLADLKAIIGLFVAGQYDVDQIVFPLFFSRKWEQKKTT